MSQDTVQQIFLEDTEARMTMVLKYMHANKIMI